MNDMTEKNLSGYYEEAQRWADDRDAAIATSQRRAWIVAAVAGLIALLEAIALVVLLPLKTVVPYTLLVDRQTGFVQAIDPVAGQTITPDEAMVRSFLAQYVVARESFDIDSLQASYRKVALWSAGDARARYTTDMQAGSPRSPLTALPRRAIVETEIRSLSPIDGDTALVRFATTRTDPGGQRQDPQYWAAIVNYRFSAASMSEADRIDNPLGFQVLRYRRDAEMAPRIAAEPTPLAAPVAGSTIQPMPQQQSAPVRRVRPMPATSPSAGANTRP